MGLYNREYIQTKKIREKNPFFSMLYLVLSLAFLEKSILLFFNDIVNFQKISNVVLLFLSFLFFSFFLFKKADKVEKASITALLLILFQGVQTLVFQSIFVLFFDDISPLRFSCLTVCIYFAYCYFFSNTTDVKPVKKVVNHFLVLLFLGLCIALFVLNYSLEQAFIYILLTIFFTAPFFYYLERIIQFSFDIGKRRELISRFSLLIALQLLNRYLTIVYRIIG